MDDTRKLHYATAATAQTYKHVGNDSVRIPIDMHPSFMQNKLFTGLPLFCREMHFPATEMHRLRHGKKYTDKYSQARAQQQENAIKYSTNSRVLSASCMRILINSIVPLFGMEDAPGGRQGVLLSLF